MNISKVSFVLLLLVLICTLSEIPASAAELPVNESGKNLVVNGDCSQGLSGWQNTDQWQIWFNNSFCPKAVAAASMYQDILIDNLSVGTEIQLSALMQSYNQSPTDVGTLKLEILNSEKSEILSTQSVEHSSSTATNKTITMLVPEGGKYARITLLGRRRNGGNLDTYFKNISLIAVSNLEGSNLKVVLEANEQLQLSIDHDLSENNNANWKSSNPLVASVDTGGFVKTLTKGDTEISVSYPDGKTEFYNVLVVDDASLYRLAIDLKKNQFSRLTMDEYTFTKSVTWTVMNDQVVTVSSKGIVTAVGEGLTIITAKDEQGQVAAQIYARVRN